MVNTRSRTNKTKPPVVDKPATPKAKPGPKPKSIRFSADTKAKTKVSKREIKNSGHQSRSTHRSTRSGRGRRRSPSPRRDFDFPYGAPGLVHGHGNGFDWRLQLKCQLLSQQSGSLVRNHVSHTIFPYLHCHSALF